MAASVNNIAATFATIPITSPSSSSSSSSNSSSLNQTAFAHSISTSWNPHTSRPWLHKSSLLSIYGRPGPPPIQSSISTVRRPPTSLIAGQKLPNLTFSYLDRNSKIKTATLSSLGKAKRLVVVGVSAAFSPVCDRFVKRIAPAKSIVADLIACVAVNDPFVMKVIERISSLNCLTYSSLSDILPYQILLFKFFLIRLYYSNVHNCLS
ncbi:hypothetical protein Acr_21g0009290 [Actinidia rufa]|uniref:glutaredoxin-dependent peroxiredoxin n=1 Tax=Actinidia rufa TaxID=165716 RepID=A0A7J0GHN6_9ERIC|nr:hypothetical protein Acr_21g0009290 [Actinidia rufa]